MYGALSLCVPGAEHVRQRLDHHAALYELVKGHRAATLEVKLADTHRVELG